MTNEKKTFAVRVSRWMEESTVVYIRAADEDAARDAASRLTPSQLESFDWEVETEPQRIKAISVEEDDDQEPHFLYDGRNVEDAL